MSSARVLLVFMVFVFASCDAGDGGRSPAVSPTGGQSPLPRGLPQCENPPRIATPEWFPEDLPLPQGSYTTQALPASFGYQRAVLVVPGTAEDFGRFVLREWPRAGWVLGRGDAEPGEVEDQFLKPPAIGAFRVRTEFCSPGYSLMLLIYSKNRTAVPLPSPTPRGVPLVPSPSPTP
ncbi:MAG: hypothetical protein M3N24_01255 [Actinomycetota bacterium]|nr:hypothetical protein [Actinomycetota bacterium]